ncbi:MAG: HDOD domain-containing protein, partial [Salinibacter sp.]
NLERAVQMIGSTTAAGLIIGLSLQRWNALRDGPAGSCLLRLIYHSEATAVLTQKLLRKGSDENSGSARDHPETSLEWPGFAKGLFHDLGKLVLIYNYPEKAGALYSLERTSRRPEKIDPQVVEHGVFGCGHTEVGAQAVASLDLPGPLAAVAEHHHDDESMAEDQDLRAVRAANLLTKTMNSELAGLSASRATLDWNTCVNDPVWSDWLDDASEPALKTLKEDFMRETILYTRFFLDLPDVETFSD